MSTPLLQNILHQAEALRAIGKYQFGEGSNALRETAELLRSKKRILLSGMGASYFACLPFQYALVGCGWPVASVETSELLYFLSSMADDDTAVVLVSRSGESVEVIRLLSQLKHSGAATVGVVNVANSTLGSNANKTLFMNSPADQLIAIQTYTATLVVFALLEAMMFDEWEQAKSELEETANIFEKLIPECVEASKQWISFLQADQPLYILGRGAALGAVSEGVLLMHETAKSPAVGMSVAQFRHGPVEVTDASFRGILIGTQAETAHLDAALADNIGEMGGQVRWIGPMVDGKKLIPLLPWPADIPKRFVPALETIPLQLAAYRKAELRGITPGDFRWAQAITTTEAGFVFPKTS